MKNSKPSLKSLLTALIVLVLCMASVFGYGTYSAEAPSNYAIKTTTSINFSLRINASSATLDLLSDATGLTNVTVLNRTGRTGAWAILNPNGLVINSTNGSAYNTDNWGNITSTLKEGRTYWRFNLTNATAGGFVTQTRTLDIDLDYYLLVIGNYDKINISLDTGNLNTSGMIRADRIDLANSTTESDTCNSGTAGEIRFNNSDSGTPKFIGCDGTTWTALH